MTRLDTSAECYDTTTVWLHWITVVLVVVLWVIGQTGDLFPRGPLRTGVWSMHVMLGFLTALGLLLELLGEGILGACCRPPTAAPSI